MIESQELFKIAIKQRDEIKFLIEEAKDFYQKERFASATESHTIASAAFEIVKPLWESIGAKLFCKEIELLLDEVMK